MKISTKLFLGFGAMIASAMIISFVGWFGCNSLMHDLDEINLESQVGEHANLLLAKAEEMQTAAVNLTLRKDEKYLKIIHAADDFIREEAQEAQAMLTNEEIKNDLEEAINNSNNFVKLADSWWAKNKKQNEIGRRRGKAAKEAKDFIDHLTAEETEHAHNTAKEQDGMIMLDDYDHTLLYKAVQEEVKNYYIVGYRYLGTVDIDEKNILYRKWLEKIDSAKKLMEKALAKSEDDDEYNEIAKAIDNLKIYRSNVEDFHAISQLQQEEIAKMDEEIHNTIKSAEKTHDDVKAIIDKVQKKAHDNFDFVIMLIISVAIIILIAGLTVSYILTKAIVSPVMKVVDFAEDLQEGNLDNSLAEGSDEMGQMGTALNKMLQTLRNRANIAGEIADGNLQLDVNISSEKDKLGIAFRDMIANLNDIVGSIIEATSQVSSGSEQVSSAAQSLSQGATEQAASLEEITSSMHEMGSQTSTNAENASQANQLAGEAAKAAKNGQEKMNKMSISMEQINANSEKTQKVVKTIDDIAFQTNLLALNAAVEAARAGVHGKGFAVVAEEVRNLAARSAKAAAETSELIEMSNKEIQGGVEISKQTGEALTEISENVSKTNDLVGEIAAASNEQAQGIKQVNQGLSQVDQVTQQNTANAEETASSSEEMSSQANMLQQLVGKFKLKNKKETVAKIETSSAQIPQPKQKRTSTIPAPTEQIILDDDEFGKF